MRRLFALALTTAATLAHFGVACAQPAARTPRRAPARATGRAPRVVAANVFEALYFKERAESGITPAALAAYGNSVVARRGLDHMFDACVVVAADKSPRPVPSVSESAKAFAYALRRVGGGRVNFLFVADVLAEGAGEPCECFFAVPALRVTGGEMLIVSEGRRYRVERPAGFRLGEVSLVDASLKNAVRTWQLPYESVPLGLSPDRAKLYVALPDFEDEAWDDGLALEISDASPRFVPRAGLSLPREVADVPGAPARGGVSYKRFASGAQSYVLRVTDLCS